MVSKMIDFEIMPMKERLLEAVARLEQCCFSVPWSKISLEEELIKENSKFLVAVDENQQVLGYIGLNFVLDEGYITNIAVMPEFRGLGVAKKLLEKIIDFGVSKNLTFISLEVRKSNIAAISLYQKFDFLPVGERKNFYSAPIENALIMTKFLR